MRKREMRQGYLGAHESCRSDYGQAFNGYLVLGISCMLSRHHLIGTIFEIAGDDIGAAQLNG
ncbi:MAG: hypothetical protein Q8J96_16265, partial [Rhodocyclaceae bacterium]|nr:hypothetical protein [Rhodocyclaceae bacterium]